MGQKVNPIGIRLGIAADWTAKWYADSKHFADYLEMDLRVRQAIRAFFKKKATEQRERKEREKEHSADAAISRIQIERPARTAQITIHTARPGVVIGKKGEYIEELRKAISDLMGIPVHINIEEIRKPELDARLVAESVAQQLERRIMFRRAMKRAVTNALRSGAQGVKINVGGRLNGAEIARSEWYREGRVPLHTLRADIDYGIAEAKTTYGVIGIKVWIFKGEVFGFERQPKSKSEKGTPTPFA